MEGHGYNEGMEVHGYTEAQHDMGVIMERMSWLYCRNEWTWL